MKIIAILGPTASGKTALSLELASKYNAIILSLDSLSIYRQIDIASAKPSPKERGDIVHFGLDVLYPNEHFDVTMFFDLYQEALCYANAHQKLLLIVGGTGFYLKALMEGMSTKPTITPHIKATIQEMLCNLPLAYRLIHEKDPTYAAKIAFGDCYRIEKWLEIFYATGCTPSTYLAQNKQPPLLKDVLLYEIETPKEILQKRVFTRTHTMLKQGLLDEVFYLEKRYSRAPQCMKAIGIQEVLDYFDGKYTYAKLEENIAIHTMQLAKRQRTFNASQFPPHEKAPTPELQKMIEKALQKL